MTAGRSVTVDGVLRRSARRTPERVAVHYRDRSWTYAELDEAVSRAAQALRDTGLAPGDRVGAYGHNSDAYLIGFLACANSAWCSQRRRRPWEPMSRLPRPARCSF